MRQLARTLFALMVMVPSAPLIAQGAPLTIPAGDYVVDKTHASVTWRVKHLGLSMYTARFVGFDSTVKLDPADLTRSSVVFTIDPNSVRTDFPFPEKEDFDRKVGTEFLKGDKHKEIRFQSTGITATGPATGKLTGNLTFAGVTKPVTFDATLNGATNHPMLKVPVLGVSARGTIKRSDFGADMYLGPIGDDVEILIEAEFRKAS